MGHLIMFMKMKNVGIRRNFLVCALLGWMFSVSIYALPLQAHAQGINLTPWAAYLEDKEGSLTIDSIRSEAYRASFTPAQTDLKTLNFGFTRSAYWIRLRLPDITPPPMQWLLEIPYTNINTLDYFPTNGPPIHTGSERSLDSRPVFHRHFVFPVQQDSSSKYVYLRVSSSYALTVPLVAWSADAFSQHQHEVLALQFIYTGVLVTLIFYNLLISFALKDLRFLFYSCYGIFLCLGMLAGNGYGRLYLWPNSASFDEISQGTLLSLSAAFAALFVRAYLVNQLKTPWLHKLLLFNSGCFFISSGLLAGSLFGGYTVTIIHQWMMANILLFFVFLFCGALQAVTRSDWSMRFFALAWLVLILGAVVATCRALGWLPTNGFTAYALQVASSIEMLLLAMALAALAQQERRQREDSQQQFMQSQAERLDTLNANKEALEAAVQERTEALHRTLTQEKELLAEYKRFGALMAHEFRNPLGIIDSQLSLLRLQQQKGINQVDRRIKTMATATMRLRRLFEKWLHNDQLSHNLLHLQPEKINLHQFLPQIVETFAHTLELHPISLHYCNTNPRVQADAWTLEIAVGNLLENACKYSPAHSPIVLETRTQPGWLGIAVIDRGVGIEPGLHHAIFQPYFRAEKNSAIYGMGLGLHLVERIAQAHHGWIELHSHPEQGSCFCLWLPLKDE
jgi:two-component system, sensor histidine kinase LadS